MANKVQQTIQFHGNTFHLEMQKDGTVVIACSGRVKLRFPYEHQTDGGIKFTSETEELTNSFEVTASPHGTYNFEVVLCDSGGLLPTKPFVLAVVVDSKQSTVYAQDGIGDWSKQFVL